MEQYNPYQAPQSSWEDEQANDFELLDEPNSLSAGSGFAWIGEAWQIFMARPLLWIGLIFTYIGFLFVMMLLSIIPFVGFVVNVAIGIMLPMLMAGVYYIAYGIDNDEEVGFGDVAIAFSQGKLKDFFLLWLWNFLLTLAMGASIAILAIAFGFSSEAVQNSLISILLFLILLAFFIPILMMSIFSPILILFHDLEAWEAMKLSFKGCIKNILPFLLNGIAFSLLFIVGFITLGLGFFVIAPMMMICIYVAYRQIFLNH